MQLFAGPSSKIWWRSNLAKDQAMLTNSRWLNFWVKLVQYSLATSRNLVQEYLVKAKVQSKLAMCWACNSSWWTITSWSNTSKVDSSGDDKEANDHNKFDSSWGPSSPCKAKNLARWWKSGIAPRLVEFTFAAAHAKAASSSGRNCGIFWVTTIQNLSKSSLGHWIKHFAKAQKVFAKYLGAIRG